MAQTKRTAVKLAGLSTYPNSLSEAPPGALQVADNVVIDKPSTVSARRGQRVFSRFNDDNATPSRLFQVEDDLFGLFTSDGLPTSSGDLRRISAGSTGNTPAATGITQPPGNAMHSVEAKSNVYLSTGDGITKLLPKFTTDESGTVVPAGMPFGLDAQAALSTPASGTQGFLPGDAVAGYQVLFGNTDTAGNLVLGAPSPTATAINASFDVTAVDVYDPTVGMADYFTVTLGYTASNAAAISIPCYVVQGSTVLLATFIVLAGGSTARVLLRQGAEYLGPTGTSVSIVIAANVASVAAGPPPVLTFSGFDPTMLKPTVGANTPVVYAPVNTLAPTNVAGATSLSTLTTSTATATTCATAAGSWTAGTVGVILPVTIATAQTNAVNLTTSATIQASDVLTLPGVPFDSTVTGVTSGTRIALSAFPTGFYAGSTYITVTVKRPSNVSLTFSVPKEVQTYIDAGLSTFYQVYRSANAVALNGEVTGTPDPNMRLAYQADITGTIPTQITITDIAPFSTLGAYLYTSPVQDGALAAKYPPPVASDLCLYEGVMWYANCYIPAAFSTTLLGVSATTNASLGALQPGDVITIAGTAFTARVSPATSTEFKIYTGSGSVTYDIRRTVASLSRVVNQNFVLPTANAGAAAETVNLLANPDTTSIGGQFTIRTSRGLGTFTLAYTPIGGHPNPFADALPGTYSPTLLQNALYFSPPEEPEAVPLLNQLSVGQANTAIQRVLPLPGSLIVFKPEGIYQLVGTTVQQFSVSLLNTTAQLLANESAVLLQSSVVAFTNQGVITVSQGGVQITSMAINDTLRDLTALPAFAATSFGVAHEAERRYMLWVPSDADDLLPSQAYTYNILTNAWTRWPIARTCGLVNRADQRLYLGATTALSVDAPVVYAEAAPGDPYPFGDDIQTGTISVLDGTTVQLLGTGLTAAATVASFIPGCLLVTPTAAVYPTDCFAVGEFLEFTVASTANLVDGDAVTYYQAYNCQFAPVPIEGDDAGTVKQFQEFQLLFVATSCPVMSATCYTDFNQDLTALSVVPIGLSGIPGVGYGSGPFGGFAFGGGATAWPVLTQNARQLVPKGATRGHYFWPLVGAAVAAVGFNVQGMTIAWQPTRSLRSR